MAIDHRKSLRVEASPNCLDAVLDLVQTVAGTAGVADRDLIRFESAVMEVVDNVISHGCTAGSSQLSVSVAVAQGWFRAVVEDDGPPVPVTLEAVEMPAEMAEGGRGLAMAAGLLDEFRYERTDQGNLWHLGLVLAVT
jgi:serine/threonine-protein kinase RsbW